MLTVVWDVDDVLNDLMYQWFTHCWLTEHPGCTLQYSQLLQNPPHQSLSITYEEYLASLDPFRKTQRSMKMPPNAQVLAWFRAQGKYCRHIALTARPLETAPEVAAWVLRHFGLWIRCFGVVPSRTEENEPAYDRSKGEFLTWIKCGDILVEDSPENICQADSIGMRTLTYPQPWNNSRLTIDELLNELSHMVRES